MLIYAVKFYIQKRYFLVINQKFKNQILSQISYL